MLTNAKLFADVEEMLRENGTIAAFEAEHGPITGRMLIDEGEVPSTLVDGLDLDGDIKVFRGSFDFAKSTVGVAVDMKTGKAVGPIWQEEQKIGAYQVAQEWVDYFADVVRDCIAEGRYETPIFAFMNEKGAFEVLPAPSEAE